MHLFVVFTSLALAVASAHSMFAPIRQGDEQSVLKRQTQFYGLVPRHRPNSLAMRIFHEDIMKAEGNASNIPEVAKKKGLTTLVDLVAKANLTSVLESKGPLTVFGPTNKAFDDLPASVKKAINNVTVLTEVLKFHVLTMEVNSSQLSNDLIVETAANKSLRVNIYDDKVYTVQCAPIDLKNVNIKADNGLIHVLNKVMIPPAGDLVQGLTDSSDFEYLVTFIQRAALEDTLSGPGPFTVFAPTDKAFHKLPYSTLIELMADGKKLEKVLLYHVVAGTACSAGLKSGPLTTENGEDVQIKVSKDGVTVNDAKVVAADGSITNGVFHAIDTVLFPDDLLF